MRLTIKRKVLQEALDVCGPVAGARVAGVRLICRCVLLAADKDGGVEVQATDMAQGVRVKIEAEAVKEPEAWALPAQVLRNVVTALPADVEVVAFDGSVTPAKSDKEVSTCKATLRAGRDCFEFLGYGPEQIPDVAGLDAGAGPALSVPAGELGAMVERVGFAACTEGRYALKGVLFEFEKNTLTLVATDGRRLALTKAKVKAGKDAPAWSNKDNTAFVYPLEALRSLRDLCARGGEGGAVELALCGWTILARGERITLSALGVEGLFPKYWVAIPKDHEREAVFNRAALIEAVQRVQGFADPDLAGYSGVVLLLSPGSCIARAASPDHGRGEVQVAVEYSGPECRMDCQPRLLLEALKAQGGETVRWTFKPNSHATTLHENKDSFCVFAIHNTGVQDGHAG